MYDLIISLDNLYLMCLFTFIYNVYVFNDYTEASTLIEFLTFPSSFEARNEIAQVRRNGHSRKKSRINAIIQCRA